MGRKSKTQMTKRELLELLAEKDRIIADLNHRIDALESASIRSTAIPLDSFMDQMQNRISERQNDNMQKPQDDAG